MIGKDFSSSVRVGYSQFPTEFHCHLCNVSFTKRKFLRMHCDGLFHRDKVILSQASTTGHQNSEFQFMPVQSNNSTLYSEADCSRRRFDGKSAVFSRDKNLKKRNDVIQERTRKQGESSSVVSSNALGCMVNDASPDFYSGSESFRGSDILTFPGFPFDHKKFTDLISTLTDWQPHDTEFHDVARLPSDNETVSHPSCRADSPSTVASEFDCKLCRRFTPDGSSLNEHLSSVEHCKLLLLRQHELGLAKFRRLYGDVPFLRILSASVPVPPPEFDENLTRIYRSAVVNELHCRACGTEHEDLKSWFGHSLGDNHSKVLFELLHQSDVYMFLSMFGDLPLPESMLPLLKESGRAEESNDLQLTMERSPQNRLKRNIKPLGYLKVIDHHFVSAEAPLKNRLHSSVDTNSTECDELADDLKASTVSTANKDNVFRNIVKVVDHNFESVPEWNGAQEQNLPSYSPNHLLESLSENLWLLKVASLSSRSASLLHRSNAKHVISHESELQLSSEAEDSTQDQNTDNRLQLESTGSKDSPPVDPEVEVLEQLNQIADDFLRLSTSRTDNDDEAINVSQCATSESVGRKGCDEISRISVLISNPTNRATPLNEKFTMSEVAEEDLTSVIVAAPFQVDAGGGDDAESARIPVLASSFRTAPAPRSVGRCTFKHLRTLAPQPNFVAVSSGQNDQSENQITQSFGKDQITQSFFRVTEAAFDSETCSRSYGSLTFSTSSYFKPASQTPAGDFLPLVGTASHRDCVRSATSVLSEQRVAVPVVSRSEEIFPSGVTNNSNVQHPFPSSDVIAFGVNEINNADADCRSSASTTNLVPRNDILVASQNHINREETLYSISIYSHMSDASAINCQSNSSHSLDMARTNRKPVQHIAACECAKCTPYDPFEIDIPALMLAHHSPRYSPRGVCSRTEDVFGMATVSVCTSLCSSILPSAPRFPSSADDLTMPTTVELESAHSASPYDPFAMCIDVNCCGNPASSASAMVAGLSLSASATNGASSDLLQLTTTGTAESDAHVILSQHKVVCSSNSSLYVNAPTSDGQSVESSDSASNSPHLSSNSIHLSSNSLHLSSNSLHLSSNSLHLSSSSFHSAATSSNLPGSAPTITSFSSAGDETSKSLTYLGYSVATMPSESPAVLDALSNMPSMATTQTAASVSDGLFIKSEPTSDADATTSPAVLDALSNVPSMATTQTAASVSDGLFIKSEPTSDADATTSPAVLDALSNVPSMATTQTAASVSDGLFIKLEPTSDADATTSPAVLDALSNVPSMATTQTAASVSEGLFIKLEPTSDEDATTINKVTSTSECLPSVTSYINESISFSKSSVNANVLSLSAAVSEAKTDTSKRSNSRFSTANNDYFADGTSLNCSEKAVAAQNSVSHHAALVSVAIPKQSFKSRHCTAATDVKITAPSTSLAIKTILKCEKNESEKKSLSSAATVATGDSKRAVTSVSVTGSQLKCIPGKCGPSVTKYAVEVTPRSTALSTKIKTSASSLTDGTLTKSERDVPTDVPKSISQATSRLASAAVQSTVAEPSRAAGTVRLVIRKLSRCTPSTAVFKDMKTKFCTAQRVTGVKNAVQKVDRKSSVPKDNAAALNTTKANLPSLAGTKTNNTASANSSKIGLASVSNARINSVPVSTIKCTCASTKTIASKPVIAQSRMSMKPLTTSHPTPLMGVAAKDTKTTGGMMSAKAGNTAAPLILTKTSLSNANPCVSTATGKNKSPQLISTASAVARVAVVSASRSTTTAATALKSSAAVASRTSVASVVNRCSVSAVTSDISTIGAQSKRLVKLSKTSPTSNPAPPLGTAKVTEARVVLRTTCSLSCSRPTSVSASSVRASRAVTLAPAFSCTASHHNSTAADSDVAGPLIRIEVVIKTEPEDSNNDVSVSFGDDSTTTASSSSGSLTKVSPPVSAAGPTDLENLGNPVISESPPDVSRSSAKKPRPSLLKTPGGLLKTPDSLLKTPGCLLKTPDSLLKTPGGLLKTPDKNPSDGFASTAPQTHGWQSDPINQQALSSELNYRQCRWGTGLPEASGNRFSTPFFGPGVHDTDWKRGNWPYPELTQNCPNHFYDQNYGPPPAKIRRLMPEEDNICNTDNFNYQDQRERLILDRRLRKFVDCLKNVAIALQRTGRRVFAYENIIFSKSLPWLEQRKLELLSEFTGIQDSRLLLSASQLLAPLDLSLLQRFTDLQLRCSEFSADVRDMMMRLLDALVEGCHRNLF